MSSHIATFVTLPNLFPLKQGLRLTVLIPNHFLLTAPKPISTKTRIKTYKFVYNLDCKTIKLPNLFPLKQGLRLAIKIVDFADGQNLPNLFPLKQGLRQLCDFTIG